MTDHDPLCFLAQFPGKAAQAVGPDACTCATIRAARADERVKVLDSLRTQQELVHEDQRWADLRAKVKALSSAYIVAGVWENPPADHDLDDWDGKPAVLLSDVLALIDGSSDD